MIPDKTNARLHRNAEKAGDSIEDNEILPDNS